MLTPLDQIASQNHLQLAKAAVSCLPIKNQRFFAVLLKVMEIQNILQFYQQNPSPVSACSTSGESPELLDILAEMRNYCDGNEQEMLDQWIQLISTIELYSLLS